jgi:hypothetical protein
MNILLFPNSDSNFIDLFQSAPDDWTLDEAMIVLSQNLILEIIDSRIIDYDFNGQIKSKKKLNYINYHFCYIFKNLLRNGSKY